MAKILGLDLGTNSIGWAVVDYERDYLKKENKQFVDEEFKLQDKGVYIFKEGVDKDSYGNPQSRAASRTDKRSARRLKFRRKLRKYETLEALIKHKMCPLEMEDLEKWRQFENPISKKKESFKHYPTCPKFMEWLQTDNEGDKQKRKTKSKNPYFFRNKAANEKMNNLYEIGRAFYHIAQRRGFLSGRLDKSDIVFLEKVKAELYECIIDTENFSDLYFELNDFFNNSITEDSNDENKELLKLQKKIENEFKKLKNDFKECKKYTVDLLTKQPKLGPVKQQISDLTDEIEKNNLKTIGQLFYRWHLDDKKIRNNYLGREEHYEIEFKEICKVQGISEYSEIFKDIYNGIFYQRKLKSQKGLVGKCTLEPNYSRCPISHPEFEEFRALKFINNIKRKDGEEWRQLNDEEKKKIWHKFFRKKEQFDFKEIAKIINPNYPQTKKLEDDPDPKKEYFNYKGNATVTGCYTTACLMSVFGYDWKEKESWESRNWQDILENPIWKTNLFNRCKKKEIRDRKTKDLKGEKNIETIVNDVWHVLFTYDKESKKNEFAINYFGANEKEADAFFKIQLKQEYASFSIKALRNINQFLREGLIETYAVFLAKIPELIPEIWGNKENQKLIRDEINYRIDNFRETKRKQTIVNDLYKNFRDEFGLKDKTYLLDAKDIENAVNKIISFYGKKTFSEKSKEEQEEIKEFVLTHFKNCIHKNTFIKIKRVDKVIQDFFIEHPALGIDEVMANKLYHPSDIEKFKEPITKKDKDGNLITDKNGNLLEFLNSPISGSIKNPTVFRALFQLRKVLDELIRTEKIDRETRVHIEVAGNLNDMNYRKAIEDWQAEREKENQHYKEIIIGLFKAEKNIEITDPEDDDIKKIKSWYDQYLLENDKSLFDLLPKDEKDPVKKYRLWREQEGRCVYTGKQIPLHKLFDGISFDIEHTIPRSKSNDNSLENLTICDATFNRQNKIGRIPFELGEEKHKEILGYIAHWQKKYKDLEKQIKKLAQKAAANKDNKEEHDKNIKEKHKLTFEKNYWSAKYSRFTMEEVPEGFTNRNLNDTRIISRYAQQWLKSYFETVHSINGNITSDFRKIWGLQNEYDTKQRTNHIHHCLDAITIACITKDKYDQLSHAYQLEESGAKEVAAKLKTESKPWKTFVPDLKKLKDEVVIAYQFLDNLPKQTKRKLRKRGKIQPKVIYKKNELGNYLLNEKGKKIIDKYLYQKDEKGNLIPIKGRKLNQESIKKKTEGLDYFKIETVDETRCYEFVKNIDGEIVYLKDFILEQGDTVRGQLHQETFYGAIKVAEREDNKIAKDEQGEIIFKKDKDGNEIFYVIRKELEKLKKEDVDKIVDEEIKMKIKSVIGTQITFKKTGATVKHPIWQNEEKQIPIKKIRVFTTVKNPLPDFKKHRDSSKPSHKYKEQIYVTNAENYCLAIYEGENEKGKIERISRLVNNIDAGKKFKLSNRSDENFPPLSDEETGYINISTLKKGQIMLRKVKNESIDDILNAPFEDQLIRLFIIEGIDKDGIKVRYHSEARPGTDLVKFMKEIISQQNSTKNKLDKDGKIKESKITGPVGGIKVGDHQNFPYQKFKTSNFNAFISGYDFKITPTGKIEKI